MERAARAISSAGRTRTVVVTGGSAGIGRATARRFAQEGARVAVLARGKVALEATRAELMALGARDVLVLPLDVADDGALRAAATQIEAELGPIDVWINNAMTTVYGRIADIEPDEYRRVTDVVYHGYVWGTQAALSVMRRRNQGIIVQVGSSLAYRGIPLQAAYCGAKHAIRAFTDSLRSELIHDRVDIHLTMVQLPSVNTPQFEHARNKMDRRPQPVPPIFQPEVAAEAIHRATLVKRREVYVGASTLALIAAQKLVPGLLDHYLAHQVWEGQLTDEPRPYAQADNLFTAVEQDAGAHGRFDARARDWDALSAVTGRMGVGGIRPLRLAAPFVGFLLGALLASRSSRLPAAAH